MMKQYHPKKIPSTPGVYSFYDSKKVKIYVGKAVNLRSRLRSYFGELIPGTKTKALMKRAAKLTWQETGSEIEALILESQLIKKYKPFYNISLRDDKQYAYVVFTDEEFPKIFVTHQPQHATDQTVGPFTSSTELRSVLKMFRKLFPFCTCLASRDPAKRDRQKHNRLCLNAHLNKCMGICCLKDKTQIPNYKQITKAYLKNIETIKDVLSGKREVFFRQFPNIFKNIKVLREIAGREQALLELQKIFNLPTIPMRIEGYDISNIQGTNATGSMVVFENGQPNKNEYRKFKIRAPASPDDTRMLNEMLTRRFNHQEWPTPNLLLIDGGKGQLNATRSVISNFQFSIFKQIPILSIAKGKQEIFSTTLDEPIPLSKLPPPVQHLLLHIDAEAHRFAINYYRKLHRRILRL